jgi:hypothetical protein
VGVETRNETLEPLTTCPTAPSSSISIWKKA